uniref:Uncharacterized protein n=1 Tax=Daucus carota subsp. sativus TaxID=79200 RepID=A0A164TMH4_DAUCS
MPHILNNHLLCEVSSRDNHNSRFEAGCPDLPIHRRNHSSRNMTTNQKRNKTYTQKLGTINNPKRWVR